MCYFSLLLLLTTYPGLLSAWFWHFVCLFWLFVFVWLQKAVPNTWRVITLISDNNGICVLPGRVIWQTISLAHHLIYPTILTQRRDYDFIALRSGI